MIKRTRGLGQDTERGNTGDANTRTDGALYDASHKGAEERWVCPRRLVPGGSHRCKRHRMALSSKLLINIFARPILAKNGNLIADSPSDTIQRVQVPCGSLASSHVASAFGLWVATSALTLSLYD